MFKSLLQEILKYFPLTFPPTIMEVKKGSQD